MKSLILISVLLFVALSTQVGVTVVDPANSIDDHYVIVFDETASQADRGAFLKSLFKSFATHADTFSSIRNQYAIGTDFNGFSAKLSQTALEVVKSSPLVKLIEQQYKVFAIQSCSVQSLATWGIDRVSEQTIQLDGNYEYDTSSGAGVDSYVIDTGVQIGHQDFQGRAIWGANFADFNDSDCNGHGTHVAGTMGGFVYGVAKQTTLIAVKVLACSGSGTNEGVISGIQWVATSYQSRKRPSVANMSLGGGKSTALNMAVAASVKVGVTFVVAAGNENQDACTRSPASEPSAITVGATGVDNDEGEQVDARAYFSNYGPCTTIFAPGLGITSAWIGTGNNQIKTISGTSMAAPHVAGVVALYLGMNGDTSPADVKDWLMDNAVEGEVRLDCHGALVKAKCDATVNEFVYSPCGSKK